ncbi:methyltransferase [Sutcliffiella deserti]|uniref:methyltransferase n=1 Tax=Sutcliffiella deserti TaxID=2875501 RepID=UPI001CBF5D0B|nr:methyltransferase [Sutcliffiella deserti]
MIEHNYDKLLNIKTTQQQKGFHPSFHYHRYEPTPYQALDAFSKQYEWKETARVVDFGCGKGRLNFYLHYHYHPTVIGIEMDEAFYVEAKLNLKGYLEKHKSTKGKIEFQCCLAEDYEIHPRDNCFYFFNPFTIEIFRNVVKNILLSVERNYRGVEIILYYPSSDYVYYMDNHPSFELAVEVKLAEYEQNANERFLLYRLAY